MQTLTTTVFNPALGKPVSVTNPNGNTTTYAYDVFNRLTKIVKSLDSDAFPTTEMQYVVNVSPPHAVILKSRETAGGSTHDSVQVIDGMGKTIQTKSEYDNPANMIAVDTYYDVMGRVSKLSNPYLTDNAMGYSAPNTAIPSTQTGYDILGRSKLVTNPDGTLMSSQYNHWTVTSPDENGYSKSRLFDSNKKLVQVIENNQGSPYTTNYQYSTLGEMLSVTDHLGNTSTTEYDSLGRKSRVLDVDLGQRLFGYDIAGNMTSQTDAKGTIIKYQYDSLGRQTLIDFPNDKDIQFVYDLNTKGTLSMVYNNLGIDSYKYDQRGRKIQEDRTMDGLTWTTKWEYDSMDRVVSQTYPDNEIVQYTYNAQSMLSRVQRTSQDIVNNMVYDAAGQMTQKSYANGWNTTFSYLPSNHRLTALTTTKAQLKLQDLAYTYDNAGNVKTLRDIAASRTETFTYDDLHRLTNAHDDLASGGFDNTYAYNAIGNLMSETDNKTQNVTQYTYGQGTAKPHAVTGKTDRLPNVGSFVIDSGKAYCTGGQVSLNNISMGNPTHYMASEDQNFTGASWQPFSTAPVFTLSSLNPATPFKTVYFKVKNANGESKVKSDDIQYLLDTDSDGIPDIYDNDKDNDGIPDAADAEPLNPANALLDPDNDGLTNLQEYLHGTNPNVGDSDGDGWSDYDEIFTHKTNPNAADTDKDGISDPTDASPNNPYNDSFSANYSVKRWTFNEGGGRRSGVQYAAADTLGSGVSKSSLVDTDGDGIPDSWEIAYGLNPANPSDAMLDADGDGLTNLQEYLNGTKPKVRDTDGDGWSDYQEIFIHHTNPNRPDSDNDGIRDPQDPAPNKQTYVYAMSENFTVRNGIFNAGGNRRGGVVYAVSSDRIGTISDGSAMYHSTFLVMPEAVAFGAVEVGKSGMMTLSITNKGSENLILGIISYDGADKVEFVVQHDSCSSMILSPSVNCSVDVSFVPKSPGAKGMSLSLQYNDGEIKNASIAVSGIATPDITPPDTTITGKPNNPSTSNSAIFTFTSSEADSTFQCRLDNAAFFPCTSPKTYSGLTDGIHIFEVKSADSSGNTDPSPATYTWTIDTTYPNPPVVLGATPTTDTSPAWSWTGGGGGNGTYRYKLDNSDLTTGAIQTTTPSFTPGSSLALGIYTLYVQERDAAGNWSSSGSKTIQIISGVSRTWTIVNGIRQTCVSTPEQLQACLYDAEADGYPNTIMVKQGTYAGNFVFNSDEDFDLNLHGGYTTNCTSTVYNPTLTVFDGDIDSNGIGDGPVLSLNASAGSGSILVDGFKIINGLNAVDEGGGIRALNGAGNIELINNLITSNQATSVGSGGGGIAANAISGDISLMNNIIQANEGDYGAGVLVGSQSGNITLINNIITDNLADFDGGGIATAITTGSILLLNNTIANNDAGSDDGGGISLLLNSDTATADLTNNIIWSNSTGTGTCQDIYIDSDYDLNDIHAAVVLMNNDFNQTTGICTTGNPPDIDLSNKDVDPQFALPANGDYHLKTTSPIIDMGTDHPSQPTTDIDGQARVSGTSVDIGADEVPAVPQPPIVSATTPTKDTTPTWSWISGGGGNGTFRYRLDNPVLTTGATTTTAKTFTPATALANGNHTLYVQERNAAGLWSATGSKTVLIDTVLPINGTVTATPGPVQISLSWNGFTDALSGIGSYKVVYATGAVAPASCSAGTAIYTGPATTYAHTGLINLIYSYRVCAIDRAGNMSAGTTRLSQKPLKSESNSPAGSMTINSGADWTKSTAATLTLTATDDSPPLQMCISNTPTCTAWAAFAATKTWTLTAGNGTKTVYASFRDTWGNTTPTATPYSDTICNLSH